MCGGGGGGRACVRACACVRVLWSVCALRGRGYGVNMINDALYSVNTHILFCV